MSTKKIHQSEISIKVGLDENKVPEKIHWDASDGGVNNEPASAFMLSVWDERTQDTLRIDLWTKEMRMDDMKKFYHQTLLSMADSFERATNEKEMALDMKDFARYFAERLELIEKKK